MALLISTLLLVLLNVNFVHSQSRRVIIHVFNVFEEQKAGTFVGNIGVKNEVNADYRFAKDNKNFKLTPQGILTTLKKFNHEDLSRSERVSGIQLHVTNGLSSLLDIKVHILDINDNAPTFPESEDRFMIKEDFTTGDKIPFINAEDKDYKSDPGKIVYTIKSGDVYDDWEIKKGDVSGKSVKQHYLVLRNEHKLDVEDKTDNLTLVISACDAKLTTLCSTLSVIIDIEDVNDNAPVFDKLPALIEIYENASKVEPIFTAKATDRDRGSNGEIEYEIFRSLDFGIHPNSGEIHIVTNDLDAEGDNDQKSVLIIAKDKGTPTLKDDFWLNIKILDCNDERPMLTIYPYNNNGGPFDLTEGIPIGTTVATLEVTDLDKTAINHGIKKVFLNAGQDYFSLHDAGITTKEGRKETKKYLIKTTREIDREQKSSIFVSASAIDTGSPPLTGTVNHTMFVADVNDNAPVFEKQLYEAKVNESESIGTVVIQVRALDADFAQNADITYSITSKADTKWFFIDEDSGEITLNDIIDREQREYVLIHVSARDHGATALTTHTIVNITILDTNDNDPEFLDTRMEFNVTENNNLDVFIGKMGVHDRDLIGSSHLTCSITSQDFRVDSTTCEIYANKVFDREEASSHTITATVTDGLGRSSTGQVIVHIQDENDNIPKFVTDFFNVSVHTNFRVDQNAAFLTAVDPDVGDNALPLFSATFQPGDGFYFSIDINSGGIKLLTDLTKIKKNSFFFTASVTDRANPQPNRADKARVQLNVLAPSTRPPVFKKSRYEFTINENNPINYEFGQMKATRSISHSETFIRYSIKTGNGKGFFSIGQFGSLIAVRSIDFEEANNFKLVVEAQDTLQPSLATNVTILITVIDQNDNKPNFVNNNNVINVKEGVAIGHLLYICKAEDLDTGKFGQVTYKIVNTTGHFSINKHSGEVRTNGSLDYEMSENHVIYIKVSDGGDPPLSSFFKIQVNVEDVNDNPPLFYNNSQVVDVEENNAINLVILTLNASDADDNENGKFVFTLLPSEDARSFSMMKSGALYVTKSLDRETKSSYSLRAQVQDLGQPPQSSEAVISVIVGDQNDQPPKFQQASYEFEVWEEMQPGTTVGEVIAVDADTGDNGKFTYFLRDEHRDKFEIETKQSYGKHVCIIKTRKRFDREVEPDSYNITIGASDHGLSGNSNNVNVKILIRNINDHPPEFTRTKPYVACVTVGTKANTEVTTVTAVDKDKVKVQLRYSLIALETTQQLSLRIFQINQSNGSIFTSLEIDSMHAKQSVYEMVVRVEEFTVGPTYSVGRAYSNYQKVVVFVVPKHKGLLFQEKCPHVTIKQSDKLNVIAKRQWAFDSDYKIGNFRIVTPATVNVPFSILPNTGMIQVMLNIKIALSRYYQLNVTADGTQGSHTISESVILNIYVVPTNAFPPAYPKNPENYNVLENFAINKPIATLKAPIDRDKYMEGKCVFLVEDPVDAPIKVSSLTREIMFTRPIDREVDDKIVVKIRVSDLAEDLPQRLSNTLTVAIHIIDVNDNPPKFVSGNEVLVYENEQIGTIIENVVALDPDMGKTKTDIEYKILSGNYGNTFELDRFSGELKTAKPIAINTRDKYTLKIMAIEKREVKDDIASLNTTSVLTIRVIDVNDKKPKFGKKEYKARVKENKPTGTKVIKLDSVDLDTLPEFQAVVYEILEKDEVGFEIDHQTGDIRTSIVHDRETKKKFEFNVIVRNVAPPHGDDVCAVEITIDDVNDNPPIFSGGPYEEHHLMENSKPVPRPFHQLSYTDADDTVNSKVLFSIVTPLKHPAVFVLNKTTGQLWLHKVLDREQRSSYSFIVEAINVQPPYHKSQQNITVIVDDENDEDPVFEKKLYAKTVSEGQRVNTTVLYVKAFDADVASNAEVHYSIVNASQNTLEHFTVDQKSGAVYLVGPLDYEAQKYYAFQVKGAGFVTNSFDVTTVQITVKDENDNRPIFSKPVYEFNAKQVQANVVIGKLKASDLDVGGKQRITYKFDPPNSKFSIGPNSGEIFIQKLDLIYGQYRLHVLAQDQELPPAMENKAEVLVTVGTQTSLKFLNSSVVKTINENPPRNLRLGKVVAVSQVRTKIKYSISSASNPEYAFRIDENTGELFVNNSKAVDFEKYEEFFLGIQASTGKPEILSFLHVWIRVRDVNDNRPQIEPKNFTYSYPETNRHPFKPMYIYQFLVMDKDKMDKNNLTLRIKEGNEDGLFQVDQWHRLSLIKNMDYETKSRHHLVVRVTDGAGHYEEAHLFFNVEDQNDNKPIFQKINPVSVSEASMPGTLVAQVTAIDKDRKKTDIKYKIESKGSTSNISLFDMDKSSGKIFLTHSLDYELSSKHTLRVSAWDGVHRSYGHLIVNVKDVNDHSPKFSKSIYTVKRVYSPLKKDQYIVKVDATDRDRGDYGFVQYKLEPSRDPFMINQYTGKIFANKPYKFRPGTLVKLSVVAYDSKKQEGSRSTTAIVEIHITQVQFPNLQFTNGGVYHFSIDENTPEAVDVEQVQAFFPTGVHKKMRYRIIGGNTNGAFSIDTHQGFIRTHRKLDREKIPKYTLHVEAEVDATDANNPKLAPARCVINIDILDVNDNQPIFEKSVYHVTKYENVVEGTTLLQVKATDADDPKQAYGKLTYSIHSGQEGTQWLKINQTDGTVKINKQLDREVADTIRLTIRVADVEGTGMEAFTSLNVTVLDVNDNAPTFDYDVMQYQEIRVKENLPPHQLVFKANARDKDIGENGRISYKILVGTGKDLFYMNESTPGWVYTKTSLDYEQGEHYKLSVLAYDHGIPKREHSVEYVIYVDDENEFQPVFTETQYSFEIYGDFKNGSVIGNISATDKDGGSAGVIHYAIEPKGMNSFSVEQRTGLIKVNKDLRRRKVGNSVETDGNGGRKRREIESTDNNSAGEDDNVEEIRFRIRADNGPNTTSVFTEVVVHVNYTCPGCVVFTPLQVTDPPMKATTIVVVLASIAVFLMILFVLIMAYFLRKKGCFNRRKNLPTTFCTTKKETGQLLNSGASSFDRLQQYCYNSEHVAEKSRVSSETGLLPDGSGTGRSVSATDKASTYSFGIYHEQGKPESEMHRLGDTLSEMTLIKELEDDSVFGYSTGKLKSEPAKSLISRSTQESSLYSLSSTVAHRNGFNFVPRQNNKMVSTTRSDSHESLKDFMEEGGGEAAGGIDVGNLLYAKLAEVNADEQDAIMESVRPFQEEGPLSHGGSFSTIIGSDEDMRRNYNYPYMNNWKPQYHPVVNSVFSEIGRNGGPPPPNHHPSTINYGYNQKDVIVNNSVATQQPLLDNVNINNKMRHPGPGSSMKSPHISQQSQQKPIADIPLQVLNSGRTSMLSSVQSLPRVPQELQSTYTSGAVSPNFTPAITPLVFRSPSVSSIGTQDDFSNNKGRNNFDLGFTNLRRVDSNVSQLSRITLSDLDISDAEIEV